MIRQINITATVAAGETTADKTSEFLAGRILKIDVNYTGEVMEVDLDTIGEQKAQKILNLASANTDTTYYPRVQLEDNTGANLDPSDSQGGDNALYGEFVVFGKIKLSLASAAPAETVTVGITFED